MVARDRWWRGIDGDLEQLAKSCHACQGVQKAPAVAPLHPWIRPARPWSRVHIDFAGPFMGHMFLIAVDAHSKWPEVVQMNTTNAAQTITVLRQMFATYGLPKQLVSDNGPQFTSAEFTEFCSVNEIQHVRVAPYHPSSNGLAERFVQTFKGEMKKGEKDGLPLPHRLASFLLTYCTTPHATTGVPPCVLMMGRGIRTRMDLLRPDLDVTVQEKQFKQKQQHDEHSVDRSFLNGQQVMTRLFNRSQKWIAGVIVKRLGPVSYLVQLNDGSTWKKHIDHIRARSNQSVEE